MGRRRRLAQLLRRLADWLYVEPTDRLESFSVGGPITSTETTASGEEFWGEHPPDGLDMRYSR